MEGSRDSVVRHTTRPGRCPNARPASISSDRQAVPARDSFSSTDPCLAARTSCLARQASGSRSSAAQWAQTGGSSSDARTQNRSPADGALKYPSVDQRRNPTHRNATRCGYRQTVGPQFRFSARKAAQVGHLLLQTGSRLAPRTPRLARQGARRRGRTFNWAIG